MLHFIYKLKRAWKLVTVYWDTCDGDWSSIAIVLRHQIRQVREDIVERDIIIGVDKLARQMLIAEECLTRLLDDTAADVVEKRYPCYSRWGYKLHRDLEQYYMDTLCKMLNKHLRTWWD